MEGDSLLGIEKKLVREVDNRRDDLVELTQALIRIPTLNPPGNNYRDICEFLQTRLKRSGFDCELLRAKGAFADSDEYPRYNLIAHKEGLESGDCVHFNSHVDVVRVGSGWTFDPFAGTVKDNKIYGRGACDMKGGLATSIIAVEAFLACHAPSFPGAIEISATADEESGGFSGVAWLAERGWFSPQRVQHVIIPEPLHKNRICLGHRGVWWAELETKGRMAHGSMPFLGDCAVRHMSAILEEIEKTLIPKLATKNTSMPVVPPQARQSTLNINSIHGGASEFDKDESGFPSACVPDRCRIVIDRRYLVEETLEEVKSEFVEMLNDVASRRAGLKFEMRDLFSVQPTLTDKKAPVVVQVKNAIQKVLGADAEFVVSPGTYDQKHIDRIGQLKNCIAYGPGLLDLAHKPDEWIAIDDMLDSAKVMSLSLCHLLSSDTTRHAPISTNGV